MNLLNLENNRLGNDCSIQLSYGASGPTFNLRRKTTCPNLPRFAHTCPKKLGKDWGKPKPIRFGLFPTLKIIIPQNQKSPKRKIITESIRGNYVL